MQPDQTRHLEQMALAELDATTKQLSEAGRTIDQLRADVLALAERVDAARSEAEGFRRDLGREHFVAVALRGELRAAEDAAAAAAIESERLLSDNVAPLNARIERMKKQLERPGRLVVKKALRRGQYAKPVVS